MVVTERFHTLEFLFSPFLMVEQQNKKILFSLHQSTTPEFKTEIPHEHK